MPKYMMLLRNEGTDFSGYTAKQFEELLNSFGKWREELRKKGKFVSSEKLKDDGGKTLKSSNGKAIEGGPYSNGATTIGGYYVVQAETYNVALSLAQGCPVLSYGGSVEVREIEDFE